MAQQKLTKLSDVVASQLPGFIQSDYETFVSFLQAYYKYLDQQNLTRNLEYLRDVDTTLDEFIGVLKNEIALLAPQLAHDRFFLRNSKAAYVSRGSEESYRCLFRFLYNKEIQLEYPGEKMFKVSAGEWQQDTSFFLKVSAGNCADLSNNYHYITGTVNGRPRLTRVYVKNVQKVETTNDVWEIFIAINFYGAINAGDTFNSAGVVGTVQPSTTKIKILKPGSNFKVGQVFNLSTSLASGCLVKVTKVNETGGLQRLQIISFGVGYKKDFIFNISNYLPPTDTTTTSSGVITVGDNIISQSDSGIITKQNYHNGYVDSSYAGQVLADFYDTSVPADQEQIVAQLLVQLGAVNRYPGYYKSSNSLISDDSYIQDGEYYQDFSYIIKIDEKLDSYRDTVLSCVHPVGRKLFGNYLIESDFDLEISISNPVIRILIPQYSESIEIATIYDKIIASVQNLIITGDGVNDMFTLLPSMISYAMLYVRKGSTELVSPTDWVVVDTNIIFTSVPAAGEKINIRYAVLNFSGNPSFQSAIFDVDKSLEDTTTGFNESTIYSFQKRFQPEYGNGDFFDFSDITVKYTYKALPTSEMLASGATQNQKDSFVMGDTGTAAGGAASTNLTIKDVVKPFTDSSLLLDSTTNAINKPLSDSPAISHATETKDFAKVLSAATGYADAAAPTDATAIKDVVKPLTDQLDSTLFGETRTYSLQQVQSDSFSQSDSTTNAVNKALTDSSTASHLTETKDFAKVLSAATGYTDEALPTDSISAKDVAKSLADQLDSSLFSETRTFNFQMQMQPDSFSQSDSTSYSFSKDLSGISFTAMADADPTKQFTKSLTDSFGNTDSTSYTFVMGSLLESFTTLDSNGYSFSMSALNDTTNASHAIPTSLVGKALTDSAINTDTGFLEFNPYDSNATFFSEVYVAGRSTF